MKIEHQPNLSFDEAYNLFLLDYKSRRFTPATIEWYEWFLGLFRKWLLTRREYIHLYEITSTHIRTYLVQLQEQGLASYTQHNAFRSLRAFFNFCVNEEILTASPMRKVQGPRLEKKILPAFSTDDVKKLLSKCKSTREKAVLLCLLDSGARASEFCQLNVGNVDFERGTVQIQQGKQQKDRITYIGIKARKVLIRSHTFRRTCALWMLRRGASIYHIQRMLGHENLDVLKQYLALIEGDIQSAHEKFGAVDNNL